MTEIQIIQYSLTFMTKGSMTDIMPQGNRLYQIKIQPQYTSYIPGNSGHQLHMLGSSGYIVIFI